MQGPMPQRRLYGVDSGEEWPDLQRARAWVPSGLCPMPAGAPVLQMKHENRPISRRSQQLQ